MSAEEDKALAKRVYEEILNGGNLDQAPQFIAPDCPVHSNDTLIGRGPDSFTSAFRQLRNTLPHLRWKVDGQCAEGNKVWTQYTATGGPLTTTGVSICSIEDGKIKQWDSWDTLARFETIAAEPGEVKVIRAQTQRDVEVIHAQQQREAALIEAQLNKPRGEQLNVWAILVSILMGGGLAGGGFAIAYTSWWGITPGWAVPVTALVAAVTVVVLATNAFGNNRSNIVIRGDAAIPAQPTEKAGTSRPDEPPAGKPLTDKPPADKSPAGAPTAGAPTAGASTKGTPTASLAAQEPAATIAVVTAILQVLVVAGFSIEPATQAAIVGGLSALAGIFIRGRVAPVQTSVRAG